MNFQMPMRNRHGLRGIDVNASFLRIFGKKFSVTICQVSMGLWLVYPIVLLSSDKRLALGSSFYQRPKSLSQGPPSQPVEHFSSAKGPT